MIPHEEHNTGCKVDLKKQKQKNTNLSLTKSLDSITNLEKK